MRKPEQLSKEEVELLAELIIQEADHYSVLGVNRDAPLKVINRAYARAVENFHPLRRKDIANDDGVMQYRLSQAFRRVEEAFRTLSSPIRRKIYNDQLDQRHLTPLPQNVKAAAAIQSDGMASASRGFIPSPKQLPESVLSVELPKESNWDDRRRVRRASIRLPALVTFQHEWQELTETTDVSPLATRLRLSHKVEPGTLLRVELPMPQLLRTHSLGEEAYINDAYVLYTVVERGERLVVIEFV